MKPPDEDPDDGAAPGELLPLTGLSHCLRGPCPRVDPVKLIHKVPWVPQEAQAGYSGNPVLPVPLPHHSFFTFLLFPLSSCPSTPKLPLCHSLFLAS